MEINFKKIHTTKDLVISAIVLAAGIGLYFVKPVLGVFIVVLGVLMLLLYKDGFKREGDDIILQKKAFDVAHSCRDSLEGFLEGKNVEPEVNTDLSGGVIRVEAYYNASAAVAYVQLFDFSNYTYEPATEIVELRGPRAEKLISKL